MVERSGELADGYHPVRRGKSLAEATIEATRASEIIAPLCRGSEAIDG